MSFTGALDLCQYLASPLTPNAPQSLEPQIGVKPTHASNGAADLAKCDKAIRDRCVEPNGEPGEPSRQIRRMHRRPLSKPAPKDVTASGQSTILAVVRPSRREPNRDRFPLLFRQGRFPHPAKNSHVLSQQY